MSYFRDGERCGHKGCLNHLTHPCEGCGRIGGKCKGLVFRYWENQYAFNGRMAVKHELVLLKRQSCKCNVCESTLEAFEDCVNSEFLPFEDKFEEDFISGEAYKMVITDWCEDEFLVRFERIVTRNT